MIFHIFQSLSNVYDYVSALSSFKISIGETWEYYVIPLKCQVHAVFFYS